jgi:hypothetical protein
MQFWKVLLSVTSFRRRIFASRVEWTTPRSRAHNKVALSSSLKIEIVFCAFADESLFVSRT